MTAVDLSEKKLFAAALTILSPVAVRPGFYPSIVFR